jgi:hypothetical protein
MAKNKKRGYVTIDIGDKKRTLHFSMNFWAEFTDQLGVGIDQIGDLLQQGFTIKQLRSLIYSGLIAYDAENNIPVDYNEYKVGMWLSDLSPDAITEVINAMTQSKILGVDLDNELRQPEKKNQTKT